MRIISVQKMRTTVAVAALVLAAVSTSACRMPTYVSTPATVNAVPSGMIPVQSLARELNLKTGRNSRGVMLLEDQRNHLLILGPPNASVTLNGQSLSEWRVVSAKSTLYVWPSLVNQIKPLLVTEPPPTPAPLVHVRPPPSPGPKPRRSTNVTVMLDAGHGGKDTGAPGRYGPDEKHITLDTTLRIAKALAARGIRVVLTRNSDTYPTLPQRIAMANRLRPKLFVSIHADSAPNRSAQGFTVYAARKSSTKSLAAAGSVVRAMKAADVTSRGVRRADFDVLAQTNCPAILVELGYLTNRVEATALATPAYRQRLARAIANGIVMAIRAR